MYVFENLLKYVDKLKGEYSKSFPNSKSMIEEIFDGFENFFKEKLEKKE